MLTVTEMLMRAEQCEKKADKAVHRYVAYALRDTAEQWRAMAVQMDLLERDPAFQRLRAGALTVRGACSLQDMSSPSPSLQAATRADYVSSVVLLDDAPSR